MQQTSFLDGDTGLTGQFVKGKPDPVSENIQPTPAEKSEQIAKIIEAFENSRHHEYGVTMRRLMEICGERSARQRVFDAKQHYKVQGETLVYRKEPDSYFLVSLTKEPK